MAEPIKMQHGMLSRETPGNMYYIGCRWPPREGHCWGVWPIVKHRMLLVDKTVSCAKNKWTDPSHLRVARCFFAQGRLGVAITGLGWAGARRELLDFMVQGKINRGRHTDRPAGRHSIQINQCPPPPSPQFLQARCPSCCPTNSVKALKATSTFGLGRRH